MASGDAPISDVPATLPPISVDGPRRLGIEFSASGGEYFRIWIVNILLSIFTLGIYSAWAKVRNKQYFYGSAQLEGASFQYTANPLNILKGRLLVVGVLAAYQFLATFAPALGASMAIGFVFLLPWVVVQALSFNARYSSHRGLRFGFEGRYGEAFRFYVLWTVFAIFSGGLAYPYAVYLRKRFILGKSRFGAGGFQFGAPPGYFYVVYVIALIASVGLMFGLLIIGSGLAAMSGVMLNPESGFDPNDPTTMRLLLFAAVVVYLFFLGLVLGVSSAVQTALTNHVWQHARLGEISFEMQMNPMRVLWIQFSNIALIILSAGLFIPWAKVRITRYRLSCFRVLASESLDSLVAADRERITATGDEFGEALDLDLGL